MNSKWVQQSGCSKMRIEVNGKQHEVADELTVADLLHALGITQPHVAVELNLQVVPRAHHQATILHDGDRLEVVTLVGGG
jgi:sulfur carrier protein